MIRIYLDKQILSKFFKQEDEQDKILYEILKANKDKMIFMFSHAHLEDIIRSEKDIRDRELSFLEELLEQNFIYFRSDKGEIYYSHYTPLQAFDFFEKHLKDIGDDYDLSKTFGENEIFKLGMEIRSDPKKYQTLRNNINDNFNKGKFKSENGDIEFNEKIKPNLNGTSFLDFIEDFLTMGKRKSIDKREMFINVYINLDVLGISRDKKGVNFINLQNDADHAFFAQCCDVLVTEDKGMLGKAPSVYKLLDIGTKVIPYAQFYEFAKNVSEYPTETVKTLFENLSHDINNGGLLDDCSSEDYIHELIVTCRPYFFYFTQAERFVKEDKLTLVLSKKLTSSVNFILHSEFASLTNQLVKLLGRDDFAQAEFDNVIDGKSISDLNWFGRRWTFGEYTFHLAMPKDSVNLVLMISNVPQS